MSCSRSSQSAPQSIMIRAFLRSISSALWRRCQRDRASISPRVPRNVSLSAWFFVATLTAEQNFRSHVAQGLFQGGVGSRLPPAGVFRVRAIAVARFLIPRTTGQASTALLERPAIRSMPRRYPAGIDLPQGPLARLRYCSAVWRGELYAHHRHCERRRHRLRRQGRAVNDTERRRLEAALDERLEETFPASEPVA